MLRTLLSAVALTAVLASSASAGAFGLGGVVGGFKQTTDVGAAVSSASSSGASFGGKFENGAAVVGVAGTNANISQNQWSTGAASLGNGTAATATAAAGDVNVNVASGALGLAAATSKGNFSGVNGSDASASQWSTQKTKVGAFGGFIGGFGF